MNRRWELDLLRGFMLVMMFTTHLPTRFSDKLGQPFGYVSAAEGFVMLSAFMAGLIYTGRAQKAGIPAMQKAFFRRVALELRLVFGLIRSPEFLHEPYIEKNRAILETLASGDAAGAAEQMDRYLAHAERFILTTYARVLDGAA